MFLYYIIAAIAGAALALGIYIAVSRSVNKGRADAIIEKATVEADNVKQTKMLEAKESIDKLVRQIDQCIKLLEK